MKQTALERELYKLTLPKTNFDLCPDPLAFAIKPHIVLRPFNMSACLIAICIISCERKFGKEECQNYQPTLRYPHSDWRIRVEEVVIYIYTFYCLIFGLD